MKTVSQCFHQSPAAAGGDGAVGAASGVSLLTLYCGYAQLIDVSRAIHGHRAHYDDHSAASRCANDSMSMTVHTHR